jgi:two-component system cell cycle response regulator
MDGENKLASNELSREDLEREIFDLRNLIEISKSLNSTLDYNILNNSILYTCLGSLTVIKAAFFSKKSIDSKSFSLHRSYLGFDLDHTQEYEIPESSEFIKQLNEKDSCLTMDELLAINPEDEEVLKLKELDPAIIVPLRAKGSINGMLILGEKIDSEPFGERDKEHLLNIASFAAIAIHNAFLFEMTTTDMMTKLKLKHFFLNYLREKMEALKQDPSEISIIMLDIDRFKNLNDTYGHLTGDEVLKNVARTIQLNVRQVDVAARYGGEEFIVLLPDADIELAKIVAERIRQSVETSKTAFNGKDHQVTISLGVAKYNPEIDETELDLIERADKALYQSKQNGRNQTTTSL